MNQHIESATSHDFGYDLAIAQIRTLESEAIDRLQVHQILLAARPRQVVEHCHSVAKPEEARRGVAADEATPTGYEDLHLGGEVPIRLHVCDEGFPPARLLIVSGSLRSGNWLS